MKISSPVFTNNDGFPRAHTCDGAETSPPLEISGIPRQTKSLALVLRDPDAPGGIFIHWILFNISPKTLTRCNTSFDLCAIHAHKSKLVLHLVRVDREDLKDPDNKIIKIPWEERGWGKLCAYQIQNSTDIDYAIFLIKQVYEKFYK